MLLGILAIVIGLGILAIDCLLLLDTGAPLTWVGISLKFILGGIGGCFLGYILYKDEEKEKQTNFEQKATSMALHYLKEGKLENLFTWYKCGKRDKGLPAQIIVKIGEAIRDDSPKKARHLTEKYAIACSGRKSSLDEAYINWANSLFNAKKYSSAQKWYQMVYEHSKNKEVLPSLGLCYFKLQNYSKAEYYLKSALEHEKSFIIVYNLFLVCAQLKQYKDALKYFAELRKSFPERLSKKNKLLTEIPLEHLTEGV